MKTSNFYPPLLKLFLIITVFYFPLDYYSQSKDQINLNSPENILKFANYLYCDGDYLRAIDEYKKYLSHNYNDTIIFKSALSYSRIGKIFEAKNLFKKLIPNHKLSDEAILEIAKLDFTEKKYFELRNILNDTIYQKTRFISSINILNQISILYEGNLTAGINVQDFSRSFPVSRREEIQKFLLRKVNPEYKSPINAAILSALIPGAGKIYTGYYADGVTSLLLTGVLGYISYADFNAKHYFRGWLFAGLTGVFYLGNIYGSAVSAQIRNAQIDFNFKLDLDTFLTKYNFFLPNDEYFCK